MRGFWRILFIVGRRFGLTCKSEVISFFKSLLQRPVNAGYQPFEIFRASTGREPPSKGSLRAQSSQRITPRDQMSVLKEQSLFSQIYGDMQQGVPTTVLILSKVLLRCLAIPKSPNLSWPALVVKIFWALRSLWMTFRSWICLIAKESCVNQSRILFSEKGIPLASLMIRPRSPPSAYSITILRQLQFLKKARNLMMVGWLRTDKILASRMTSSCSSCDIPKISICFKTQSSSESLL